MKLFIWVLAAAVALLIVDRTLLWMEARGWIYYRRHRPAGGGSLYHLMQIHSIYEPGIQEVIEAKWHEEESEDESGDPPAPQDNAEAPPDDE